MRPDENSGRLWGHLNSTGTYTFRLKAQNDSGSAEKDFTIFIRDPDAPEITTGNNLPAGTTGNDYDLTLARNGRTPITWEKTGGTLPPDLTLERDSGRLHGRLSSAGTFTFTVKATNSLGSAEKTFTLTVSTLPFTLSGDTFSDGIAGTLYSGSSEATGGVMPYSWEKAGNIPSGLSFSYSGNKAVISGTPSKEGYYNFSIKASDSTGNSVTRNFSVNITVIKLYCSLSGCTRKGKYREALTADGGTQPYTYKVSSGTLPEGMNIAPATGVISGTASRAGTFKFTVSAEDANGMTASKSFTVKVTQTTLTGSIPATITRKASCSWTLKVSGGTSPYTFTVSSGKLPAGLSLNSKTGKISGTPTKAGTYTFTIKAKDKNGAASSKSFTVKVTQTTLTGSIPATITRKASCSWTLKVSGGTSPYTWSVSSGKLPDGLKLKASTGKISGTPTKSGSYKFTIKAKDKNGAASSKKFTVKVVQPKNSQALTEIPELSANTRVIIPATLEVLSSDILSAGSGRDSDLVNVQQGKAITFILGKWLYLDGSMAEVSDVQVIYNFKPAEGITFSEDGGKFTLPAEMVDGGFCVSVRAKSGGIELETDELHITATE